MSDRLRRAFFGRPVDEVAAELLGCVVVRVADDGPVAVRLSEVESYHGRSDPASHAYRGPTPRSAVMFGPPGFSYVYFTYGMHWCLNVVCETDGEAAAVLLRAGEVVDGLELARARRPPARSDRQLARGPANLARCLGMTGGDSGRDLTDPSSSTFLVRGDPVPAERVRRGPRVGVRLGASEHRRLWIADDPTVSAYRAATQRPRGRGSGA